MDIINNKSVITYKESTYVVSNTATNIINTESTFPMYKTPGTNLKIYGIKGFH